MKKLTVLLWAILLTSNAAVADIRLPNILSSNMVLQQNSEVKLWGWASPGEKVIISTSWDNKSDTITGTGDANWMITVRTPAAGGPYKIIFKGKNTIVLDNVMMGEVWVCSGQSNMEWGSNQHIQQILDEIPNSANTNIRLFHVSKTTSSTPQDNVPGSWETCGPSSLQGFSAVAYFFGKQLQSGLNVPIGLISSNWGGTAAEVWTPSAVVENNTALRQAAEKLQPTPWWPYRPGSAYNSMIYPLINFSISGVIWYQGESNVTTSDTYSQLFTGMIGAWRTAWKKEFPFYYVQIAPFNYQYSYTGALLREQQLKSLSYPNTGMVVITDLVNDIKNIHPKNKREVGFRLANLALGETYKKTMGTAFKSPLFRSMEIQGSKAILSFDNAPDGLLIKNGKAPTEFYLAGADKKFVPGVAKIEKGKITVTSKLVDRPVAVRFAFSNTAMANLFSKEGLPVSPFRTDDWKIDTLLVQ